MLFLQIVHELQDLRLDRNVQSRGRLVRDEQLRLAGQCHGDHDTLTHTAGQLMRILLGDDVRIRDLDIGQHFNDLCGSLLLRHALMDNERLADLTGHGEDRVQAGHRLLEDDGDIVAADGIHFLLGELREVTALEEDLAAVDIAVAVEKLQDAHGGDALAGTGLADNAERASCLNGIGNAVDRLDNTLLRAEESMQIF